MSETTKDLFLSSAKSLLGLIESDFGQSGEDVRIEAIRCELEGMYMRGVRRLMPCGCGVGQACSACTPSAEERGV